MAVYDRGYRAYDGPRRGAPAWWVILREHLLMAKRRRGPKWLLLVVWVVFLVMSVALYMAMGLFEMAPGARGLATEAVSIDLWLRRFFNMAIVPSALAAMLVGAGLIADDLRTRALPLFLVRPLTPVGYALGKVLVLPCMLCLFLLLPGVMLFLLVGLWQPPGQTMQWLSDHSDTLGRILRLAGSTTAYLTGLMLVASCLTTRRGSALAMGAAAFFAGPFLAAVGRYVGGAAGDLLRAADLLRGATREFHIAQSDLPNYVRARLASDSAVWALALGLMLLGAILAWRRARTAEVTS